MANSAQPQIQARPQPSMILLLLALPPLVLLRRELGYRLVHPGRLLVAAGLVAALPHAINVFYGQPLNGPVLIVFAIAVFALGLRHRLWHGRELAGGTSSVHSFETGYSVLASALPTMPVWLAICVDPVACIVAGYVAAYICPSFGIFMMLCGGSLGFVELRAYGEQRRHFLDTHDGLHEARRHGDMAEHHAGNPRARPQAQAAGTAAGVDSDIDWHLRRRG